VAAACVSEPASAMSESGYFLKRKAEEQRECYERLECEDPVPYYDIVCERGDVECLERKRRLAAKALSQGFDAPGGGALGVFAFLSFTGPAVGILKAIAKGFGRKP
jgi:hypothetical protein